MNQIVLRKGLLDDKADAEAKQRLCAIKRTRPLPYMSANELGMLKFLERELRYYTVAEGNLINDIYARLGSKKKEAVKTADDF